MSEEQRPEGRSVGLSAGLEGTPRELELLEIFEHEQEALKHPVHQVYFRAGLIACREYMARFVECENPVIAQSIRANWWPDLGDDLGAPRQIDWAELTEGEYGEPGFRCKGADEVSPTLEALPIALAFLMRSNTNSSADSDE